MFDFFVSDHLYNSEFFTALQALAAIIVIYVGIWNWKLRRATFMNYVPCTRELTSEVGPPIL